jgi:hypothetical protein
VERHDIATDGRRHGLGSSGTEPLVARTWILNPGDYPSRESLDEMLDELLPPIEAMPGFRGCTVLVNREDGAIHATVFWADDAALRAALDREANAATGAVVLTGSSESRAAVHDVLVNRPAPTVLDRELGADRW